MIPSTIETGICKKLAADSIPVDASDVNAVKRTMTKTSSTDAPAKISCGILLSVPYPSSISRIILGTITAGDTAARTLPMIAASNSVTPSRTGASRTVPASSMHAGTKHIKIAGLPTFLRSSRFRDKPALVRIMTSAICRKSDEISKIEASIFRNIEYGIINQVQRVGTEHDTDKNHSN